MKECGHCAWVGEKGGGRHVARLQQLQCGPDVSVKRSGVQLTIQVTSARTVAAILQQVVLDVRSVLLRDTMFDLCGCGRVFRAP